MCPTSTSGNQILSVRADGWCALPGGARRGRERIDDRRHVVRARQQVDLGAFDARVIEAQGDDARAEQHLSQHAGQIHLHA